MSKPKAVITNARTEQWGRDMVIVGDCLEHEGRPDLVGHYIHTSRVLNYKDGVAETMNTLYTVHWAEPDATAPHTATLL